MRLEEVLSHLSNFGLQLKSKKCAFMQTEVMFLGHIVGRTGLACDPVKLSAVRNWHAPDKVKGVRQFVGFVGYYRRFVKDFADLAEPLVALTRKGAPFVWTDRQQQAFEALKACLISAPILGFPTEDGRFVLDTDASLFAVAGVLSQLQDDSEVVIAYASRSLHLSQWRYCTTRQEMLAAVVMCTHFRSYLWGLSLHSVQTIAPSGGSRDSGMKMACWPAGICYWDSSRLRSSTVQALSMQTRMGCPANVASVSGLLVRCRRWIRRSPMSNRKQGLLISLLPRRKWVSLWTRTCCQNCPVSGHDFVYDGV